VVLSLVEREVSLHLQEVTSTKVVWLRSLTVVLLYLHLRSVNTDEVLS
jgi:hypothetical protein